MEIKAFFVADNVIQTSRGKLSISGVFDIISSKSFPAIHKSMATMLIFEGKNKKYKYELFLRSDSRPRIRIVETEFTKRDKQHKVVSRIENLPLSNEGIYIFEVELDGKLVANTTIDVKKI